MLHSTDLFLLKTNHSFFNYCAYKIIRSFWRMSCPLSHNKSIKVEQLNLALSHISKTLLRAKLMKSKIVRHLLRCMIILVTSTTIKSSDSWAFTCINEKLHVYYHVVKCWLTILFPHNALSLPLSLLSNNVSTGTNPDLLDRSWHFAFKKLSKMFCYFRRWNGVSPEKTTSSLETTSLLEKWG